MNELGPVVQQLGSMRKTSIGQATMVVSIILGVVALLLMVVSAFVMILGFTMQYLTVIGILATVVFLAGAATLVFSIVMALQVNGTTAHIHANGLTLGQSWFRRAQVPWAEVVRIDPPTVASTWIRFDLVLRSGQRICADRLRLKPVGSTAGQVVNHPDVQAVLNHYAAWQQAHGGAWQQ